MTSNVGSRYLQDNVIDNEISESARESVMADLRDHFRPEFLNRIDDTVLFKPLSLEEITEIVDLFLIVLTSAWRIERFPLFLQMRPRNGLEKKDTILPTGHDHLKDSYRSKWRPNWLVPWLPGRWRRGVKSPFRSRMTNW